MHKPTNKLSTSEFAQLTIAKASLRMSPLFARIGGMTHRQARETIRQLSNRKKRYSQQTPIQIKS